MNILGIITLIAFCLILYYGVWVLIAWNAFEEFRYAAKEGAKVGTFYLLSVLSFVAIIITLVFLTTWAFG